MKCKPWRRRTCRAIESARTIIKFTRINFYNTKDFQRQKVLIAPQRNGLHAFSRCHMTPVTGGENKRPEWWMGSRRLKRRTGFLFQVAWLRVDTQTILTIANHVITKNHRIGVTHSEHKTWLLHIRDVRESDRGNYMCQINTDPMKSQIGYLEVVGSSIVPHVLN